MKERYVKLDEGLYRGSILNEDSPLCVMDCVTDRIRQLLTNYCAEVVNARHWREVVVGENTEISSSLYLLVLPMNCRFFLDEEDSDESLYFGEELNSPAEIELGKLESELLGDLFSEGKSLKNVSNSLLPLLKLFKTPFDSRNTYMIAQNEYAAALVDSALKYSGKFQYR
ncbi:MAG: hypothetical protein KC589_03645 [Nanoarchaeota archaeon]|nr:hypothetical protein [Nanoarchaeota archaeon]